MPVQYKYRAVAYDGESREGILTAEKPEQVVDYLSQQNLIPISITPFQKKRPFSLLGFFRKTDYDNLILFTHNLLTMYRAGIPMLRALSIMQIGPKGSRFNQAIEHIRHDVQSGKQLSQAMANIDGLFPPVYISCVAAGEEAGKLEEILEELASLLERDMELSRQIKSGIRYPLIVIFAIAVAFVVLMTYVIPKFVGFYEGFGAQLPLPTRVIIAISNFFTDYWMVVLGLVVGSIFTLKKVMSTEKGKLWIDRKLLKVPILGNLIIKGNVARFTMMFRILFQSGLPIVKSLEVLQDSVKNSAIGLEIKKFGKIFREGKESALTSKEFDYFPEMSLQMMAIGLESGSLDKMLHEISMHYSKDVQYTSRHLTSILEPVLTLIIGLFILVLALAIFLPMWNLISVFKGG